MARAEAAGLWIALLVAGGARLALEVLAMPPYAGLDEGFHVARASFVAATSHNPTRDENSVPLYLARSMGGDPSAPWDFAMLGPRWPEAVSERREGWPNPPVSSRDGLSMVAKNYETQQPSLYYSVLGRLLRMFPGRGQIGELMFLRGWAVGFALLGVAAAAGLAARLYGAAGFMAAGFLVMAPAWLTLVCRSGNDAMAFAAGAVALALTLRRQTSPVGVAAEATAWSVAVAAKLTVWPLAAAVVLAGDRLHRSRMRTLIVAAATLAAAGLTVMDLEGRTGSFPGYQVLTGKAAATTSPHGGIDFVKAADVFVASAIWPGAQHGDALKGKAMFVYAGVFVGICSVGFLSSRRRLRLRRLLLAVLLLFGIAQAGHAWSFLREAARAGLPLPIAGFEGWYLWTLAPVLVAMLLAPALSGLRRRPVLLVLVGAWLLAWDLLIHEGALYRAYAGLTSPAREGFLFRWGPLPGTTHGLGDLAILSASGAPLGALVTLRSLHVAATAVLIVLVIRRMRVPAQS
jgi:hypothetical protein